MNSTAERFRELVADGRLDLPFPAEGHSGERLTRLADLARRSTVGIARLAEAHTDALAILHEAGRTAEGRNCSYGVWASETPGRAVRYDSPSGTISGEKPFGTGVGIVDRALITAVGSDDRRILLDVDVATAPDTLTGLTTGWATSALRGTATGPVVFDRHPVGHDAVVGGPNWYLTRPGFWHGACAPTACWAGAAFGIVDAATHLVDDDPHRRAQHGALVAHQWTLEALLRTAATDMDGAPGDVAAAEYRARALRYTVERACTDILDRFSRVFGPRPFTSDVDVARRSHDLHLYLRQHHGERELGALSSLVT